MARSAKTKRESDRRRLRRQARDAASAGVEQRASEAATVGWMLFTLLSTLSVLGAVAASAADRWIGLENISRPAVLLPSLLLFTGAVAGGLTLALTVLVLRLRREPPPTAVTVFAVCAGVAPWLLLVVQSLG